MDNTAVAGFFRENFRQSADMVRHDPSREERAIRASNLECVLSLAIGHGNYANLLPGAKEDANGIVDIPVRRAGDIDRTLSNLPLQDGLSGLGDLLSRNVNAVFTTNRTNCRRLSCTCGKRLRTLHMKYPLLTVACFLHNTTEDGVFTLLRKHTLGLDESLEAYIKRICCRQEGYQPRTSVREGEYLFCDESARLHAAVHREERDGVKWFEPVTLWCPRSGTVAIGLRQYHLVPRRCALWPDGSLLYVPERFHYRRSVDQEYVAMTDSLETAQVNYLACAPDSRFSWVSWYSRKNDIAGVDLDYLTGKHVYYLLIEHSGYGTQHVYETACAVRDRLKSVKVKSLTFVSYLYSSVPRDSQSGAIRGSPLILNEQQFDEIWKEAPWKDRNSSQPQQSRLKYLLEPLIREQSISVVFGEKSCGKTWIALSTAYAISQGFSLEDGWTGIPPGRVLYVNEVTNDFTFGRQLDTVLKMQLAGMGIQTESLPIPSRFSLGVSHFPDLSQWNYGGNTNNGNGRDIQSVNSIARRSFFWVSLTADEAGVRLPYRVLNMVDDLNRLEWPENRRSTSWDNGTFGVKLVVLDGLSSLYGLFGKNATATKAGLRCLCESMKQRGCALILVLPGQSTHRSVAISMRSIPVDNILELRSEQPLIPYHVGVFALFHKLSEKFDISHRLAMKELATSTGVPKWIQLQKPLSIDLQNRIVRDLRIDGYSWLDAARLLCRVMPGMDNQSDVSIRNMSARLRQRETQRRKKDKRRRAESKRKRATKSSVANAEHLIEMLGMEVKPSPAPHAGEGGANP
jgi:hypothetical protein